MRAAYTGVQKLRKKLCIQYKNATAHYKNNIGMSALDPTGPNISNIDTNGMHTPFNIHGNAFASSASSASSAAFAATTAAAAAVSSTATSAQQAQTNINNYLGKDNLIVFQEYLLKQLDAEKDDDIFTPDGHFGEQTTRGLQSLLAANETELKVDGILGENTIRRLQSFVNKEILRRNIGNTILEDGDLGEKTLKALERLILREKAVARLNKVKPQHEFQFRMSLDIDDANVDVENKRLLKEHLQPQTRAFHPMHVGIKVEPKEFKIYSKSRIQDIFRAKNVSEDMLNFAEYYAASSVLPMRANNYVVDQLIDWTNVPNDPIFQLTFPQPGMLHPEDLKMYTDAYEKGVSRPKLRDIAELIRNKMNPHPAGQKQLNVPFDESVSELNINSMYAPDNDEDAGELQGMQHKYRETVLFFPKEGQFCHAYCTYCFRWAQFTNVGSEQQFASGDGEMLHNYLAKSKQVNDILFTGGDPMVMQAKTIAKYIDPLLQSNEVDHLQTIRIGTKSLAYWPYRYVCDPDAAEMLKLFERIVQSGRHVSIMAHFTHPRELSTPVVQEAIRLIRSTGANIRTQAPLIANVNDNSETWATMWRNQVRLGMVPYYMFVERDTGARHYFEVPLHRALNIYQGAFQAQSGLARTVRGPSMSATPGKVHVVGKAEMNGEQVFALKFLQARNPDWQDKLWFAKYDESAVWLDDLKPAFGESQFFWEKEMDNFGDAKGSSGQLHTDTVVDYENMVIPTAQFM